MSERWSRLGEVYKVCGCRHALRYSGVSQTVVPSSSHARDRAASCACGESLLLHKGGMPFQKKTRAGEDDARAARSTKKRTSSRKGPSSLQPHIKKLSKREVSKDIRVSSDALGFLELLCDDVIDRISSRAVRLMRAKKSLTLNSTFVHGATSLEFPPLLSHKCHGAASKAVATLRAHKKESA